MVKITRSARDVLRLITDESLNIEMDQSMFSSCDTDKIRSKNRFQKLKAKNAEDLEKTRIRTWIVNALTI